MPNQITSSPNIAVLDSRIAANLCTGNFEVDISPSVWIGTGYDNVLGTRIQVTNPYNVIVRAYPSGYDVTPAFSGGIDAVTLITVPTQSSNFQFGTYVISVQLTDSDGTNYTVTKSVAICAPNPLDKTKGYGIVSATISGICNQGKVYIQVAQVPTYKGFLAQSTAQTFTLNFPTGSGFAPITTSVNTFSVQLFEGVYQILGSICATYNYGDNVYADVSYQVSYSKPILCSLDECCVFTGLSALNDKLNSDCSDADKKATQYSIEQATLLISTINYGVSCGQDVSSFITNLESVLGLTCSCNFNNGTPIVNNNPSEDILIQGCNVESEKIGLTTVYNLNLYSYVVSVSPNGGVLNVSDPVINGCIVSKNITFNISTAYAQIKGLASASLAESQYWASVVKASLNTVDATCLGINSAQLAALSFDSLIQLMINKSCSGASCTSTVNTITAIQNGGDVTVSWTQTDAYSLDIYVDNIFLVTVLSAASSYNLAGYADGNNHTYRIVSKCSNGIYGTALQSTFGFAGCPAINPPIVSMTNISNANCPFDLTGLVSGLPTGITAQWHTTNNHLPTTLVPNQTSVTDGVYYVFATNGSNCWSTSVQVTLVCAISSSCSAPQNLGALAIIGGVKVYFQSAAYPPPGNSYTIKRKLAADPDVDGSYTVAGIPTFNVSTSRWEWTDTTASANTAYTYKAISNCTTPQALLFNYANITCPTLTLTTDSSSISYSFAPSGGGIDKYQVQLWDVSGITLIHTDTYTPSFSNPIAGSFTYLTSGTTYKVIIVPFIGTYSSPCPGVNATVVSEFTGNVLISNQNYTSTSINSVSPNTWINITGLPITDGYSITGTHGSYSGSLTIGATYGGTAKVNIYKNGVLYQCSDSPGSILFTSVSILETDDIEFRFLAGSC